MPINYNYDKIPLTFVILTKNSMPFISKLLLDLDQTVKRHFDLVIVDSASKDGTIKFLEKRKDIRLIKNYKNVTPGQAMNQAFNIIPSNAIIIKLDSDIRLNNGWLNPLLKTSFLPKTGVVGARLFYPNGSIQHAGGIVFPKKDYPDKYWRVDCCRRDLPSRLCPWVSGACFLITPNARKVVGQFDERYPFWFDDIDYCFAVREAGLRVRYCRETKIYHLENSSNTPRPEVYISHQLFIEKWGEEDHLWTNYGWCLK